VKRTVILLIKVVLTVLVFWALFTRSEISLPDLLDELQAIKPGRFVPWLLLGIAIKLVGIFANIWRWQLLLRGQELHLDYRFLAGSFFIGRFFGIVTPGTLGLDGFKLYDTIRVTKQPVACAAVIAIDKVIGFVGLASLLIIVFPIGWELLPGFDETRALMLAAGVAGFTAVFFAILLAPGLTKPLAKLVPGRRIRGFVDKVMEASTAYAGHREMLLGAVGLAILGHLTTALMYWTLLMGLSEAGVDGPGIGMVLFSALLMTSATLVGPTVGGEGIRELVFVKLLEGMVAPTRSFLFGHLGFWIEKGLLGLPGGIIYAMRRSEYDGPITRADLERVQAEAGAA
jgi:uncharacterized membrane protein YbhN (UPF0104 family)